MRDASILLNDYYDDEKCAQYNKIFQRQAHHLQDYDDFEQSLKVLEQGILAVKFNYCNKKNREIIIRISEDHTGLQYKSKDAGIFEVWKDIKFKDMKGILYGGISITFKQQKKSVMKSLNEQRQSEEFIEWPMFGDRTPLKIKKTFEPYQSVSKSKEPTMWEKIQQTFKGDKIPEVEPFYAWECITLIRGMFNTSFDVVIRDMHHLLCLIHVVHRSLYGEEYPTEQVKQIPILREQSSTPVEFATTQELKLTPTFMIAYKKMKFKMKLAYESYMKNVKVGRLFNLAIYKTIIQRQCMAANNLSSYLT